MAVVKKAAVVGAGVIGSAWAARFALHGVDVSIVDPNPETTRIIDEVFANARAAWSELELPPVTEGTVTVVDSIADAVAEAHHVQESAPENLDMKREILAEIDQHAPPEVVVASSTSGIKPTDLQALTVHPERLLVGHPFNPVYLLPLVEVCGGERTAEWAIAAAMDTYSFISMKPLHVRVEIDAFIADRLLEAVWREALWLINDGVATTEEIDDAIRYGFGLRWAQMGLFETYRVAGGEGGVEHFIRQFGPTLALPWSKLTDVPELSDELVDMLVAQSDAQSGQYTTRELERVRDRNLVAILMALEANDWAAGKTLTEQRNRLTGGS
ncbi:MAG: L-carnitine dehydrogenase [Acidimicrobiaceae bacterium]|nr:L-carnitine dehydrogenase [Acidimicrobiaceae bacterium]MYD07900.1 L-carnitine dehydrogenase [Acidimicrobiaceae bacterium]MYI59395.1 L-carnitine dehydrogenase [Acidimicrobiaceae bacterium]